MNAFNRFLVILGSLTCIAVWVGALLLLWFYTAEVIVGLRLSAMWLQSQTLLSLGIISAFGLSFVLVSLLILIGEFSARSPAGVRLLGVAGGGATVSVDAIVRALKDEVERLDGVQLARPRVQPERDGVRVRLEVRNAAGAQLPALAEAVSQSARGVLEERMGVKLRGIAVHFMPDNAGGAPGTRPPGDLIVPGVTSPSETVVSGETRG